MSPAGRPSACGRDTAAHGSSLRAFRPLTYAPSSHTATTQLVGDSSAPALLAQLCVDTWELLEHAALKNKSVLLVLNKRRVPRSTA